MEKELLLACIIGPVYLVYGLSILLYAKQWKKVVSEYEKNHFVLLPLAMMFLVFGLILVHAFNEWAWTPFILITITGWCLILKSVFYFLAPGSWIKAILKWKVAHAIIYYYVVGVLFVTMGITLCYNSWLVQGWLNK